MSREAELNFDRASFELPIVEGSEGEKGIDIGRLCDRTGHVTLDPSFGNTGSCCSAITFIDGDKGILRHRGYAIEELCERSNFVEMSYLLIHGQLPNADELREFRQGIHESAVLHEGMKNFFDSYPLQAHPMAVLSSMVCSLSAYEPELLQQDQSTEQQSRTITNLLAKLRVLAAFTYRRCIGAPFPFPRADLDYVGNFLHMMFWHPVDGYEIDPAVYRAVDLLFMLHADHEQNCSTSTVRMVGSSKANLFAAISSGVCALWGPLHGGANQAVMEMLEAIHRDGGNAAKFIARAKDKNDPFRLMGFGHRVYKSFDPRAAIIKSACHDVLERLEINDPLLDIALKLEESALSDEYFVERRLYPNVDFYSGIIYRALGIPTAMFTVMFALGRLPGWIAHWKELVEDPSLRISRPRQIYTGEKLRSYVPLEERPT